MNKDIKAKWVEALRSGDYEQGHDYLKQEATDDDGNAIEDKVQHCCLGVLCELAIEAGVQVSPYYEGGVWSFNDNECMPPEQVAQWAGFGADVEDPKVTNPSTGRDSTLATLNDEGNSFEAIAKVIEEQL